jgi:antitoxin (DNA-binding transcriptional repressor) of toxin-antitoxin stability system
MSRHSVTEAQARLPELIDRALKGEDVVITRDGDANIALTVVAHKPMPGPMSKEIIDWLEASRVGRIMPKDDAVTLIRKIRDEEPERASISMPA